MEKVENSSGPVYHFLEAKPRPGLAPHGSIVQVRHVWLYLGMGTITLPIAPGLCCICVL
jgi:hypothetical protein